MCVDPRLLEKSMMGIFLCTLFLWLFNSSFIPPLYPLYSLFYPHLATI